MPPSYGQFFADGREPTLHSSTTHSIMPWPGGSAPTLAALLAASGKRDTGWRCTNFECNLGCRSVGGYELNENKQNRKTCGKCAQGAAKAAKKRVRSNEAAADGDGGRVAGGKRGAKRPRKASGGDLLTHGACRPRPCIAPPSIAPPSIAPPSIALPSIAPPSIASPSIASPSIVHCCPPSHPSPRTLSPSFPTRMTSPSSPPPHAHPLALQPRARNPALHPCAPCVHPSPSIPVRMTSPSIPARRARALAPPFPSHPGSRASRLCRDSGTMVFSPPPPARIPSPSIPARTVHAAPTALLRPAPPSPRRPPSRMTSPSSPPPPTHPLALQLRARNPALHPCAPGLL